MKISRGLEQLAAITEMMFALSEGICCALGWGFVLNTSLVQFIVGNYL